jgi:hypothetical protein
MEENLMKKMLLIMALVLLAANSALAIVDVTPNKMGLYWDNVGDTLCRYSVSTPTNLYLICTSPYFDTIEGFECGIDIVGDYYILGAEFANPNALDVAAGFQNFIVGFGTPTNTQAATLLVTLNILPTSDSLEFYLHESSPASIAGDYPVILGDGELRQMDVTSIYSGASAIMVPYVCEGVVATEEMSWESVKSLYR